MSASFGIEWRLSAGVVRFDGQLGVEFGGSGFYNCRDLVIGSNELANLGGESLIGVVGYRKGCGCPGK